MPANAKHHPRFSTHKAIKVPEITTWLEMVEGGKIVACQEQHQLCTLVRRVFAEEKLWVDTQLLAKYLDYQKYFPFKLEPDEKFMLALWLCTFRADGMPRFPDLLALVGRGFGKNGFASFSAFCLMSKTNGVDKYHVDLCATTEEQARTSYDEIWNILEDDKPFFKRGFDWNKVAITNKSTKSNLRYRTGNANTKDGGRPGAVFFDEIHAYTDWSLLNVFTTGLGKKQDPRRLYITTDGEVRDGPLDDLKKKAGAILCGDMPDGGFLPFVCKLDAESEVHDETNWPKANPRVLTNPVLLDQMRREYADYKLQPLKNVSFMTKRMNLPQERKDVAVTSWENLEAASCDVGELEGLPCVCGIDYAKTTDMIGACLLFHDEELGYRVLSHAWFCDHSCDLEAIKAPLDEWERMGLLTIVHDVEVSPETIAAWVERMAQVYDIRCVSLDNYRITLMKKALAEVGFKARERGEKKVEGEEQRVWLTRPSDIMRVQPVIDSAFATHAIAWGDNPLMRWATNNAKLVPAPHDNFTYGKIEPHGRKTDPFMALVAAFAAVDKLDEPKQATVEDLSFIMPITM